MNRKAKSHKDKTNEYEDTRTRQDNETLNLGKDDLITVGTTGNSIGHIFDQTIVH